MACATLGSPIRRVEVERGNAEVSEASPTLTITDIRSVWGLPLELTLGAELTVLVGPHRSGTSNVAWCLALALDPDEPFRPSRDLPRRIEDPRPRLRLDLGDRAAEPRGDARDRAQAAAGGSSSRGTVEFDPDHGTRTATGTLPAGPVVRCGVDDTPRDVLRRVADLLDLDDTAAREQLAATLTETLRRVLREVRDVDIDERGLVDVHDDQGSALPLAQVRALIAVGVARHLHRLGHPPTALIVEAPEAFLHPAAQEDAAGLLLEVAHDTAATTLVATTSPFVIPRLPTVRVVALARDALGRTRQVRAATGDEPQARLLGGLLRDAGLASVFDRVSRVPADARGVLVVEGGTDEAYLRTAAKVLGREDALEGLVIQVAGGAMAAALEAILLRAERRVPVLVLLDGDEMGRRARDTLVSRFEFDRRTQVTTYAEVIRGQPRGVEAEALFDVELVRRFVAEQGPGVSNGEVWLETVWHVDLTGSGKAAFVGWLEEHARPEHLEAWSDLLDVLESRLPR